MSVYYSGVILGDVGGALAIFNIAVTEYVVMALLCLLTPVCDGAVGVACMSSRMGGSGRGVFRPLPSGTHRKFDDIGLLEILCSGGFYLVGSLTSCVRSFEVDCALNEPAQRWYSTHFSPWRVFEVLGRPWILARCIAAGNAIPASKAEPRRAVRWWCHGSPVLKALSLWFVIRIETLATMLSRSLLVIWCLIFLITTTIGNWAMFR